MSTTLFTRPLTRFLILSLVVLSSLTSGCLKKGGGDKPGGEDVWIKRFKSELGSAEKRFFEARYVQDREDPFYLGEILLRVEHHFAANGAGIALPADLVEQIDIRREDFEVSFDKILTRQLTRTQLIFAVASVLPSYQAYLALNKVNKIPDPEVSAWLLQLQGLIEKGSIFNKKTQEFELSPQVGADILELSNKIAKKTLVLIRDSSIRSELESNRVDIMVLNPTASKAAGEIEVIDPMDDWNALKQIYIRVFANLEYIVENSQKLDVSQKLLESQELRHREMILLQSLVQSTEKQFNLANRLTVPREM